jgi:hypothetical protein
VKTLVTEYRCLGQSDFWSKYTANGKRLPVTSVLEKMKIERLQADREIAELAKVQYGNDFSRLFTYRKAGQSGFCILSQAHAIARRYRELQAQRQG